MYNTLEKTKKNRIILLIITSILLIILFSITSLTLSSNKAILKNINIENLDSISSEISTAEKEKILFNLFDEISLNSPLSLKITNNEHFIIDAQSIYVENFDTYNLTSFTIEYATLQQNYEIRYYDYGSQEENKLFIQCVKSCTPYYNTESIRSRLPYSPTNASSHWILNTEQYYSPNNHAFEVSIDTCNENLNTAKIEADISNYLLLYNITDYTLTKKFNCFYQY